MLPFKTERERRNRMNCRMPIFFAAQGHIYPTLPERPLDAHVVRGKVDGGDYRALAS